MRAPKSLSIQSLLMGESKNLSLISVAPASVWDYMVSIGSLLAVGDSMLKLIWLDYFGEGDGE